MISIINKDKKMKSLLLISTSLALIFSGCSSSKPQANLPKGYPDWYLNPPKSDKFIYGVGQAKKQNPSMAKKVAANRARGEISQAVSAKVSTMIKDFMQESGIGENAQALEFNEAVTKTVSSNVLNGSTISKIEQSKDGTIFVLIEMSTEEMKKEAVKAAQNNEALFNEFKARQGFSELEDAINNM
ncbi:MAG: hypothetical protein CMG60_02815 [Candidatus Marinimicrobia bacterium]|nr:hypothetical protein [Candidatus Neomarinimicrobiota bacterium]